MTVSEETPRTWISYSGITTHRDCPQRWQYRYIRGLEKDDPDDVKVELEFGNWWHALRAADSIERGVALGSLRETPTRLRTVDDGPEVHLAPLGDLEAAHESGDLDLRGELLDHAQEWWDSLLPMVQEEWIKRIGTDLVTRLVYADERWHERWAQEIPHEEPLAVEFFWKREMPTLTDPQTAEVADPETDLLGYVDEIYYDTRRGMVVARDHKTHKEIARQSSADNMMDSQLQIYAWGASPDVTSWGKGPIKAVAYDRVKMVHPSTPNLTKSGRLAQRGGVPAVGSTDLVTYKEWAKGENGDGVPYEGLRKDGSGAGMYTEEESVVEQLSSSSAQSTWFQRSLTPLNMNVVRGHLRAAVDSAFDIRRTRVRVKESHEASRNLTSKCKWCPFVDLCRAEMLGGPDGDYDLEAMRLRSTRR